MPDITFPCPYCKQPLEAPSDMVGQLIDCPSCSKALEIPVHSRSLTSPVPPPRRAPIPKGQAQKRSPLANILMVAIPVAIVAGGIAGHKLWQNRQEAKEKWAVEHRAKMKELDARLQELIDDTPPNRQPRGRPGVTYAQYNQIKTGMTYSEVVSILGPPDEELSSMEMAGFYTVVYMWEGTTLGGNMNVMLQNNQVINKAQAALK